MSHLFITASFANVLQWVLYNSYPIIFLGMVIEGPTIIAAVSFAATLGYFNLQIIFILAILGDLVGDFIWYGLGYFARHAVIEKYGHFFGVSASRMDKIKHLLEKHPQKILLAIKLSPLMPVPGLIVAGSSKMSLKKFVPIISLIILPKTILFMSVGYFFGRFYNKISVYLNGSLYALGLIFLAIFFIRYIYKKGADLASEKLEQNISPPK